MDHQHQTCTTVSPTPIPASCIPPPVDGNLLQIMPWPSYKDMTEHDLRAIYEYLSAIPCIAGPPAPSPLHNDCGDDASFARTTLLPQRLRAGRGSNKERCRMKGNRHAQRFPIPA